MMAHTGAARQAAFEDCTATLYDQIGAFLIDHGLSPDPLHYEFAYRVVTEAGGPLARAVAELTDGGFRLSASDVETMGGEVSHASMPGVSPAPRSAKPAATRSATADGLVAQTQMQVEGFSDMVHAMRTETQGFGRDLAASADAMRRLENAHVVDDVVHLTSAMLDRVRTAETKLDVATEEANVLRAKLEEARENARRDPLTDLPNRRAFEEAYEAHVVAGDPISVALCDVDHFKQVNDRFGHAVGDRVLKAVADALRQNCGGHLVARYGGEEFGVIFTGGGHDAALETLNDAREIIARKRFRLRESDEPLGAVTFSAGLIEAYPEEAIGAAVGRADRLLYAAKKEGRNQVKSG